MESLLFPTRAWSRRWFGNCHWLAKRIHWLALLQSQEKRAKLFCLSWPVLFSWVMDTLDPSSDDDINNDVNSLYIEIIEQECTICGRKLSRKQRLEPTWVMFTAKVRNNTSQSQFWMWLQIVFYPHFFIRKIQKQLYAITEVHWNSRLQMVMHSLKGNSCKKIYLCSWSKWFLNIKAYGPLRSHLVQPKDALERTK